MQAQYINPFLAASIHVLESMISIRPSVGVLRLSNLSLKEDHVWLKIGVVGQMTGDIVFGFPKTVALQLVSAMMGGYAVTELDEMTHSAIGELGNMISGNASTMLFDQGVKVDITPPRLLNGDGTSSGFSEKAFNVPISIESIGDFDIFVISG